MIPSTNAGLSQTGGRGTSFSVHVMQAVFILLPIRTLPQSVNRMTGVNKVLVACPLFQCSSRRVLYCRFTWMFPDDNIVTGLKPADSQLWTMQAVFTVLPIRVVRALGRLASLASARAVAKRPPLRGDQIYDLICMATFVLSVGFLWTLNAGAIYFWMKDLNQEWLKLQVIYTAVEIFDKVC